MANRRIRKKLRKMREEIAMPKRLPSLEKTTVGMTGSQITSESMTKKEKIKAIKKVARQNRKRKRMEEPEEPENKLRIKKPKIKEKKPRKVRSDKGIKRGARKKPESQPQYPMEEDIILDNLIMLIQRLENADTSWGISASGNMYQRAPDLVQESEHARINLLDLINSEINSVGQNEVARRIENSAMSGDLNATVDMMLHGNYIETIRACYQQLASTIKGSMLSMEDTQYWGDIDSSLDGNYGEE